MVAKTNKKVKSDWEVKEDIQKALLSHVSDELAIAERNNEKVNEDFEAYYNMLHSIREAKPNDFEPDIFLPEFLSRHLSQVGNFVAQYFGSTDFVETDIDSDDARDVAEAKASKKLLNTLLKDKEAYYYQKIVRLISFVFNCGYGIIKAGYRQKVEPTISHYVQESSLSRDPLTGDYLAQDGTAYMDPTFQRPAFDTIEKPVYKNNVIIDTPIFDVYPNQNVYMSPEYTYSLNDKEYVIFETEKTIDQLRAEQEEFGYFNLDLLDQEEPEGVRGEKTYNKDGDNEEQDRPVTKTFVIYERWGKYPVIQMEDGTFRPGITRDGKWGEKSQLKECIIHYAKNREFDDVRHIIGFRVSPHSRRPMVRFLCYVDMTKDNGFGDGEVNRELQKAVNDNYNLMNYRTQMSVTPWFKGKKYSGIPEHITVGPRRVLMMDNPDTDLKEMIIQDNIAGGLQHHALLSSRMDFSMATAPQSMGAQNDRAETATVATITNQRANVRMGMKSMNLEFIGFTELYDVLLSLVNDFMLPETLEGILGEDAYHYNPKRKDKFKPVSQALETEEGKQFKIKTLQGIMGMIAPMQNPKTAMTVNMMIGEIFETLGKNFKHIKKFLLEDNPNAIALYQVYTGAKGAMGSPPGANPMTPASNQTGLPQGAVEQQARAAAPNQTIQGAR